MELAVRSGHDRFVPAGAYRELERRLRLRADDWADMPAAVLSCVDLRTRQLPFNIYDNFLFPLGARSITGALHSVGFLRSRAVYQLWNPNFRPSEARLDGKPLEMFLVSAMQIHSAKAYEAIADAHAMGEQRPLIIAGGPKAVFEPYHYWSQGRVGPDVVVTGEQYVLLDMLNVLADYRCRGDSMRVAFERARRDGALNGVPGLVFRSPDGEELIDTGLQRLVQCFDELPDDELGLSLMEPAHRGRGLSAAPIPDDRVGRNCRIVNILLTQGCKFNCPYCPIPALQQKTWRFRSPESVARVLRRIYERYGIRNYFGADDNFFNHRETAEGILKALADEPTRDGRLGKRIRWGTEATQFDTFKNRDLLPLAYRAGLWAIWFGIEDLTAELINKGQKPEVTVELFRLMQEHRILPMAMIMFHEGQPFYTRGNLYGLWNQVDFLRRAGAASVQCTVHTPAAGTREYEKTFRTGRVMRRVGSHEIGDAYFEGNHVTVAGQTPAWKKQIQHVAGYASFYNPLNFLRAMFWQKRGRKRRVAYQAIGMIATLRTAIKQIPWVLRLMFGKKKFHTREPIVNDVPVRLTSQGVQRMPVESAGPASAKATSIELPIAS